MTNSGVIRWDIDKDAISKYNIFSPEVVVGGMQWRAGMYKSGDDNHISFFLFLKEGRYQFRTVEAEVTFRLINHGDDSKNVTKSCTPKYGMTLRYCGESHFIELATAIDGEKGFIKDNKLTLQVEFTLTTIKGFSKLYRIDFTDSNEDSHDVALVIEGEKVFASKQYLSIHSPVFHAMFNGEFAEKNKEEIELKDVDRMEFIEMLSVIYPPSLQITYENFHFLLKLGDFFKINLVLNKCEQFLIAGSHPRFTESEKLVYAGRYRLTELQDHCLGKLNSTKEVKDLQKSDCYKDYTDEIYLSLFHKIMSIAD